MPTATLRPDAKAAFLPVQMLKDPQIKTKLAALHAGRMDRLLAAQQAMLMADLADLGGKLFR